MKAGREPQANGTLGGIIIRCDDVMIGVEVSHRSLPMVIT